MPIQRVGPNSSLASRSRVDHPSPHGIVAPDSLVRAQGFFAASALVIVQIVERTFRDRTQAPLRGSSIEVRPVAAEVRDDRTSAEGAETSAIEARFVNVNNNCQPARAPTSIAGALEPTFPV